MLVLYMLAGVAIGLVISTRSRTPSSRRCWASSSCLADGRAVGLRGAGREHAGGRGILGRADPIRWMLIITRGLFLQDLPVGLVLQPALPIAAIGLVTFLAAWICVRRAVT